MNLSLGLTAWRDERSIDDAIKHHDRAGLAVAISLALSLVATLLKGTKYAQYAAFLDADTVTAVGLSAAGLAAGFGHWAARGALAGTAGQLAAGVARSTGYAAADGVAHAAAPVGGVAADAGAAAAVRPEPQAAGPTGNFMP